MESLRVTVQPGMMQIILMYVAIVRTVLATQYNTPLVYDAHPHDAPPAYKYEPVPFAFGYSVKDSNHNEYSHDTKSNGRIRTGTYRVALPDGRMQVVNYKADYNGYFVHIKYYGEAQHPDHGDSHDEVAESYVGRIGVVDDGGDHLGQADSPVVLHQAANAGQVAAMKLDDLEGSEYGTRLNFAARNNGSI